jgi:hypothetical protein
VVDAVLDRLRRFGRAGQELVGRQRDLLLARVALEPLDQAGDRLDRGIVVELLVRIVAAEQEAGELSAPLPFLLGRLLLLGAAPRLLPGSRLVSLALLGLLPRAALRGGGVVLRALALGFGVELRLGGRLLRTRLGCRGLLFGAGLGLRLVAFALLGILLRALLRLCSEAFRRRTLLLRLCAPGTASARRIFSFQILL